MTHNCRNSSPCILALDTSCGIISACVIAYGHRYEATEDENDHGKTRSTRIIPLLHSLLAEAGLTWKQLDALSLGAGPGSFTGIRIAAATLAGINAGLHLPIIHLSSLAITARQITSVKTASEQTESAIPVRVLEDARAGEMFCGYYHDGRRLEEDRCLTWEQVENLEPGRYCCHGEPPILLKRWQRMPLALPRSRALALETEAVCTNEGANLGENARGWHALSVYPSPVYLQLSQAERQAHGS